VLLNRLEDGAGQFPLGCSRYICAANGQRPMRVSAQIVEESETHYNDERMADNGQRR
jgi:hypothetical protein